MNRFLTFMLLLITTVGFSQQALKGRVVDQVSGDPLLGATVVLKGTQKATTTDFDGYFSLQASVGQVVRISYVGYKTKEVSIENLDLLTIALEQDVAGLDAVVVIGYGNQAVKEITGAVSVVNEETIENLKPTRIEQALQGQVPGVQITSTSGAPGAASNIRIRGIGTNGDSRPLILVDGIRIEDLSTINPGDIESLTVLKDATAGIYGVQAANGVILITTKGGRKNQKLTFEYDAFVGFQDASRRLPTLDSRQYALLTNEAFANNGQQVPFTSVNGLPYVDYQNEVLDLAPILNNTLNIKGGTEKSVYSFGIGYLQQAGVVGLSKSGFDRTTLRFNFDHDWTDNLTMKSGLFYTNTSRSTIAESGLGSVLFNALNMNPTIPIRDANGDFSLAENLGNEVINPLAQLANTFNDNNIDKISGNFGLTYDFLEHFEATARIQFNYSEANGESFLPQANYGAGKVFNIDAPIYNVYSNYFRDYIYDAFINYNNTFGDKHNLKATIGMSASRTTGKFNGFTGIYNEDNPLVENLTFNNASLSDADDVQDNFINGGDQFDSRLLSQFARVQYDYDGTYLLSAVIRRDGSTAFGPDNRFGYFPSASAGWVLSNEEFLAGSSVFDFLKLRASYGVIGNDRIPAERFRSVLNGEGTAIFDNQLFFGAAVGALSNPGIKWEENYTANIGVDANFLAGKLSATVDVFNRRTEDLLLTPPVSGILGVGAPGASAPVINSGTVENRGFEIALSYNDKPTDDFNYGISYNIGYVKNEVTQLAPSVEFIEGGAFGIGQLPPSRMQVGEVIGFFYGYKTDGIFQNAAEVAAHPSQIDLGAEAQPGDFRYVDINGDGLINTDDRTNLGDPLPDVTMGLNLNFNYKNFDFQTYLYASIGNDIVRNYERNLDFTNTTTNELNRWTGPGTTDSFPRVTTGATSNNAFSDFFVEDGSFLRIQNAQVGYTLNNNFVTINDIKQIRFYASVNNLFTFTKYRGYDPSASNGAAIGGGIDNGFYPVPRTFLLGANVKF